MSAVAPGSGQPVGIDLIPFGGWPRNLRLSNGTVELITTLDVGPRILSFARPGGTNPFKLYAEHAGGVGEAIWRNRGGHRLWIAPESLELTYHPDNAPVAWEPLGPRHVRFTPPPETAPGFQKQIDLRLAATGADVTVVHRVTRLGAAPARLALWALTVMTPGGVAFLPQPAFGEHPRDLLPNRRLVVWPYTDLSDPRWRLGRGFFRLRQDPARPATKIGLAQAQGWSAYHVGDVCFLKRFPWEPAAVYPDDGCNFEIFSNAKMLELESLGPLTTLQPGQTVEHVEHWSLHDAPRDLPEQSDEAVGEYFAGWARGA